MTRRILVLLWALLSVIGIAESDSAVVRNIGASSECTGCPSPIPLTITTLCTISCPNQTAPSFTSSTRFWGTTGGVGACVTSTDGGTAWGACASQPFTTGSREFYAGASDGSVIAIGTPTGPNTCTIRRSINNGASWSTVFTVVQVCTAGSLEGQRLYCLSDGRCEFVGTDASTFQIFRSSNNGQTWAAGETGTGGNCAIASVAWDGSVGVFPSELTGCGGGGVAKAGVATTDIWTTSAVWNGTQGDCWGAVVYNGVGRAICQGTGATPDGRYTLRSSTGANIQSLDLPGATITGIDAGGVAISIATNNLYVFANVASGSGVFVSRDGLTTFTNIGTLVTGLRGGNVFYINGCIYLTTGTGGSTRFTKIC